jgi:hypothetical protein
MLENLFVNSLTEIIRARSMRSGLLKSGAAEANLFS